MPASPTPVSRPRTVAAVFWCWVLAAVLTAAFGMLIASASATTLFRVAGVLLVVVGLAQGYLAGRAGRGHQRFASAGVGLAMATVAVLAVLLFVSAAAILDVLVVAVIMILLITGSVLSQRQTSQQWYEGQATA